MSRLGCALLLMAISTGALAQEDSAFVRSRSEEFPDVCLWWKERSYTYRYNGAGSERTPGQTEFDAMEASFSSWRQVGAGCSDFLFVRGASTAEVAVGYRTDGGANENLVVFRAKNCEGVVPEDDVCRNALKPSQACGNKYACWFDAPRHDEFTYASTLTTYRVKSGVIVDADIEFNAAPTADGRAGHLFTVVAGPGCEPDRQSSACVAIDLQNTLTHEIGHAVGIEHSEGFPLSTMAPHASLGETTKRVIDRETAAGFCSVYPAGKPTPLCESVGSVGNGQDRGGGLLAVADGTGCSATGGAEAWAALAVVGWAVRRRKVATG